MKFAIKQGNELLTSHSGLALIGQLLHKTQIQERLSQVHLHQRPSPEISHGAVAQSMIGLLCLGKPDFAAIEPFRQDSFFATALHLDFVPSEAILRDWWPTIACACAARSRCAKKASQPRSRCPLAMRSSAAVCAV